MKMRRWIMGYKRIERGEFLLHPDAIPIGMERESEWYDDHHKVTYAVIIYVVPKDLEDIEVRA